MHRFRSGEIFPFLDSIISEWFDSKYSSFTEPQRLVIPLIHQGKNVLVSSPTGTGKTLTGFLSIINELFLKARDNKLEDEIFCLYVSPLKALANDINKNLQEPLSEIYELADTKKLKIPKINVAVRSGDTDQKERQKMLKKPPHILITTPESFALALTAPKFREKFKNLRYVIVDEIHEISSSKRGSMLSANLERLQEINSNFVRIGLSATQAPLDKIANFLCGFEEDTPRPCEIIDIDLKKQLDLMTITPVEDLTTANFQVANEKMYDVLAEIIQAHKTTLIFTNTRSSTEQVAVRLKARGIEDIEAHHSSLGKETRLQVEEKLKKGNLKCVISSTSLELGIDIGSIDIVVQIGSPKSVSKGLQRIGRAGHSISRLSTGRFVVFTLDDLVECAVLTKAAYDRTIDRVSIPENPLDVLTQIITGMVLETQWDIRKAYDVVKRSYAFHTLKWSDYMSVVNYLSGKIDNNNIFSKIWYDEEKNIIGRKKSTRMIYFMNLGTIPDDSDYKVVDVNGRHLGQLSDKFVERMVTGDIFVLGARTYSLVKTRGNRVIVRDATGLKPTIPSWTGEMLPRSKDLGTLIGRFRDYVKNNLNKREEIFKDLIKNYHVDENGARSIIAYIKAQNNFFVPTDQKLLVEGYFDDEFYNIIFFIPLGRRINDAISRAYAQAIANTYGKNTRITVTDDGFMITLEQKVDIRSAISLVNGYNFTDLVKRSISNTTVFKERFRQCAARSFMILRRYKGHEVSTAIQQLRSDRLLRALEEIPDFPVIKETYREIMEDLMDVPAAEQYVKEVIDGKNYEIIEYSKEASPFSLSLVLAGVSDVVLMEDRAKLMRELQSRILDRVYGTELMDFKIKDSKIVEEYFKNKIPSVHDEDSYLKLLEYFPFIDIARNRVNSPFPYSTEKNENIVEMGRKLVNDGKLVSIYLRSTYFTIPDRFKFFSENFRRVRELKEIDMEILKICKGKTIKEISSLLKKQEQDVKTAINDLESMYLIYRKYRDDQVEYHLVEENVDLMSDNYSYEKLIHSLLYSMGPMTLDEILVKIPGDREKITKTLDLLVSKGIALFDYITPVFAKQYILKEDLEKLLEFKNNDPARDRIGRFLKKYSDPDQYMENIGFYVSEDSMKIRVDSLKPLSVRTLRGHFFKHKMTIMNEKMAMCLQVLRKEDLNETEQKILDFLSYGNASLDGISRHLSIDIKDVKQIMKGLEHRVLVSLNENNMYSKCRISKMTRNDAMKTLLKFSGPLTQNEIMSSFWFYIKKGDLDGIQENSGSGGTYYGTLEKVDGEDIILPIDDPVFINFRRVVSHDSPFNGAFFSKNAMNCLISYKLKDNIFWIHQISEEKDGAVYSVIRYVEKNFSPLDIIFTECNSKLYSQIEKLGFKKVGSVAYKNGKKENARIMYVEDSFNHSLKFYGKLRAIQGTAIDVMPSLILGLREPSESLRYGISWADVDMLLRSDLMFTFCGPAAVQSIAPIEAISIFRSLRSKSMGEEEKGIIKLVIGERYTEGELILESGLGIEKGRMIISQLYDSCVICKNSDGTLRIVPEKFDKEEAAEKFIKGILEYFGQINFDLFRSLSLNSDHALYSKALSKLISEMNLTYTIFPDIEETGYIRDENVSNGEPFIVSPRDLFFRVFKNIIKSLFKTGKGFLLVNRGRVESVIEVKRNRNEIEITGLTGEITDKRKIMKILSNNGFSVSTK
ncbi:ATP-dependent helicase [Caldiplasma sukawensis]